MQFTPPHSPPTVSSSHAAPSDKDKDKDTATATAAAMFAKRPISPPLSSSGDTSEHSAAAAAAAGGEAETQHAPVSLLSALLHSPHHHQASMMHTSSGSHSHGYNSGYLSPHSSVPSTAVSSPHLHPNHTGQHVPAMSILRRDSCSSDAEMSTGMAGDALSMQPMDVRTELPKRACSLKFAVAPPSKRRQAESGAQGEQQDDSDIPAVPKIKADVPQPQRSESEDTPTSVNRDDDEDEDEEDNEDDEEVKRDDESEDSDLGYQEDSEQSSDDEDRIRSAPKYPFARSTNYHRRRRQRRQEEQEARSPSPPPAPSVLPPPARRGRGHIRVDESCISGKETEGGGCSRHRSPPPSKSRSTSGERGERMGRLSDAGPRRNRAGSPMPTRIPSDDDEDGDEDEDQQQPEPDSPRASRRVASQPGWRSDDAAFREPVKTARAVSAPSAVPLSDGDDDGTALAIDDAHGVSPPASGMRSFFRRASEHLPLPAFRRPSTKSVEPPLPLHPSSSDTLQQRHTHSHALPIHHACPPALDNTPALANSIARVETNYSGGLAHRLEKQLSTRSSSAGRPGTSGTTNATATAPQVHAHA